MRPIGLWSISMILSMCSAPTSESCAPDGLARAVELAGQRPIEDLGDERALATPRHPGHRHERPERDAQVDVAQVVLARATHPELLAVALPAGLRDRHRALAPQERAGHRAWLGKDGLERAVGDDLAAVLPCPGPDVDDPVGGPDGLLVVLDDQDGVAQVAQPGQGRDQLGVVALVETDRRLVEDVQDAHQGRPDLGGQADPLRLAAGQGHARPVEGQVVQPDVDEEAEPGDDLLEQLVRDRPLAFGQGRLEPRAPDEGVLDRHRRDVPDVEVADGDREDLRPEPLAVADRAWPGDHELLELGLDVVRVRLAIASLEVGDDTLEGRLVGVLAAVGPVADDDPLVLLGVEQVVDRLGRQVADGRLEVPAVRGADRLEDLQTPRGVGRHPGPRHQGAVGEALRAVRDDEVGVDLEPRAEAGAGRARAVRRVEREAARLELVGGVAVVRAAVLLAVATFLELERLAVARRRRDQDHALAQAQRRLDRVGQPARVGVRDHLAGRPGRSDAHRRRVPRPRAPRRAGRCSGRRRPRSNGACTCRGWARR